MLLKSESLCSRFFFLLLVRDICKKQKSGQNWKVGKEILDLKIFPFTLPFFVVMTKSCTGLAVLAYSALVLARVAI